MVYANIYSRQIKHKLEASISAYIGKKYKGMVHSSKLVNI